MKAIVLGTVLALGSAGYAAAADAIVEEVVVVDSAYNWSGVYVGGQIGYASADADYVYDYGSDPDYNYSHDPGGFIGGIYAGYNHQFSNGVVLGAEADIIWGDLEDSSVAAEGYSATTNLDWNGSARVRLGYAMGRFLPYVTGGIAFGHFDFEELDEGEPYGDGHGDLVGWTIGAGAEYAVTDNWIVRGEYRYTDFNTETFVSSAGDAYDLDVDSHDIRLGVAYKF